MRKVLSVVGARPQLVKAAVVSRAIASHPGLEEVLVHTGQHYDDRMSAVFLRELDMAEPAVNLGIGSGPHGVQTGRMLAALEPVIQEHAPDWVLVYGDTNSTLAAALAAAKLRVPVAHVEAGLRSFNRAMPEEVNRIVTDHVAELLFAPTAGAVANLIREGLPPERIREVGDVMYDAVLFYRDRAGRTSSILETVGLEPGGYVLSTIHRAENTDDPRRLEAILGALRDVAEETIPVVLPIHPRTRKMAEGLAAWNAHGALRIIEPVGYLDMARLQQYAAAIATDSGGVQKEAFFHGIPCVTLREETEWVELVELGWNRVCPPRDRGGIADAVRRAIGSTGRPGRPYGDGRAGAAIADHLAGPGPGEA